MALWVALYAPVYVVVLAWAAAWSGLSYDQVVSVGLVSIGSTVTSFPAIWGWQSEAVLQAIGKANLDFPELIQAKREYLRMYGRNGREPAARRWAVSYVVGYLAWTGYVMWAYVVPPHRPLALDTLGLALVAFAAILVLMGLFAWRLRSYAKLAESRGFPFGTLAVKLRKGERNSG